jgi:hypothetical protein
MVVKTHTPQSKRDSARSGYNYTRYYLSADQNNQLFLYYDHRNTTYLVFLGLAPKEVTDVITTGLGSLEYMIRRT